MQKQFIDLDVNDTIYSVAVEPKWMLSQVLREQLSLIGTKEHCGEGACGMCTVLIDGDAQLSCMTPVLSAVGKKITTIEGLEKNGKLHPVQRAFVEKHGAQCGYCTPGMIMSAIALLNRNPDPTDEEIQEAMAGNICRCGNYEQIVESIRYAAELLREGDE